MTKRKPITIITPYHFGKTQSEAFCRLIDSLLVSLTQICRHDHLILVANGTKEGAADPAEVIEVLKMNGLPGTCLDQIVRLTIERNEMYVGALNRGVKKALELNTEWIASVQSSAKLLPGWIDRSLEMGRDSSIGAIFGRILREEDREMIHNDGHILNEGRTLDVNHEKILNRDKLCPPGDFPCLSAGLFRRSLVNKLVSRFGDFVCENLSQYGDCTDIAIRARSVEPNLIFAYCKEAVALKRKPKQDYLKICCSQVLAAAFYYSNKQREELAEDRVIKKVQAQFFLDVKKMAEWRKEAKYCPNGISPPKAYGLDRAWLL